MWRKSDLDRESRTRTESLKQEKLNPFSRSFGLMMIAMGLDAY